jgi:hypothetical protein
VILSAQNGEMGAEMTGIEICEIVNKNHMCNVRLSGYLISWRCKELPKEKWARKTLVVPVSALRHPLEEDLDPVMSLPLSWKESVIRSLEEWAERANGGSMVD